MKPMIQLEQVSLVYSAEVTALNDITFDVYKGDLIALIGPNGAGKSTLMKAIMGIIQPNKGSQIAIDGGRDRLGYIPQYDDVDWSFPVTVRDVVMMGLTRQIGWFRWPNRHHREQVMQALERVNMHNLANRQIHDLSGGQRRRMFMARALAQSADIMLMDEPFAGVDISAQSDLMDIIASLNDDGITIVLSTHDLGLAFRRFKRVVAINQQLIAVGTPQEVYKPSVLSALYGGAFATWHDGDETILFVDDHTH